MGPVRASDARLRPQSPRHPARRRNGAGPPAAHRYPRPARVAGVEAGVQARTSSRDARQALESTDLFAALFEDSQGVPAAIMRKAGIEPESLVSRITARVRDIERDD